MKRVYELRNRKTGYTIEWNISTMERAVKLQLIYGADQYKIVVIEC